MFVIVVVAVEPHVERPRAAEAVVSVERPPPPQPSVVPSLSSEPVGVPPAVAAEVTAVEFEEVGFSLDVQIQDQILNYNRAMSSCSLGCST